MKYITNNCACCDDETLQHPCVLYKGNDCNIETMDYSTKQCHVCVGSAFVATSAKLQLIPAQV